MTRLEDSQRALLLSVLETAKGEGALGPGPVVEHLDHALAWAAILPTPTRFIDLGSGGGLPGLVLALASQGLINRFFQWRYDTALVFVQITPRVAATCVAIAVPLGVGATVAASWALLRRNGLRLARR